MIVARSHVRRWLSSPAKDRRRGLAHGRDCESRRIAANTDQDDGTCLRAQFDSGGHSCGPHPRHQDPRILGCGRDRRGRAPVGRRTGLSGWCVWRTPGRKGHPRGRRVQPGKPIARTPVDGVVCRARGHAARDRRRPTRARFQESSRSGTQVHRRLRSSRRGRGGQRQLVLLDQKSDCRGSLRSSLPRVPSPYFVGWSLTQANRSRTSSHSRSSDT